MNKNKNIKLVRTPEGDERILVGLNPGERKAIIGIANTIKGSIKGDTFYTERAPYQGHTFFCQVCELWRPLQDIAGTYYPEQIVCMDCAGGGPSGS